MSAKRWESREILEEMGLFEAQTGERNLYEEKTNKYIIQD